MVAYLKARAREAGTWRALGVWSNEQALLLASAASGLISAAMPE